MRGSRAHVFEAKGIEDRFWSWVEKIPFHGCWEWTGHLSRGSNGSSTTGYGRFQLTSRGSGRKATKMQAHRFAYELENGPVPDGLVLDHLCRNPACVNPLHLEPVTPRENILRGATLPALLASRTHCRRGHEFTDANTLMWRGARRCRECERINSRSKRARAKLADALLIELAKEKP